MSANLYFLYLTVAFFYIVSPGPAVFLSINYGAKYGIRKTATMLLGNITGLAILATISAIGIGLIILSSPVFLTLIKFLGSLVLLYLGSKMLYSAYQVVRDASKRNAFNKESLIENRSYLSLYREGVLLSLTNPKPLIFFSAIYPQFLEGQGGVAIKLIILGGTFVIISFVSMNIYSIFGRTVLAKFLNGKGVAVLNLLSGITFVIMSILLFTSDLKTQESQIANTTSHSTLKTSFS